ncbi:MAG: oligosaccharide flippase family protein [Melioribacteraceae bacterium]|nr:oligosaccharide flippase family protein [Melioribacteraceae bacterium]
MFDKIKQLSKETLVYGISNIVGRFLNFLLVPFYSHVFAPSEFGEFSLVYAYLTFLNLIYIYGMDAAFLKYHSLAEAEQKKDTFSTGILTVIITTAIFSVIFFLLREPFRNLVELSIDYSNIITYVILILFLDTIALIPFANLRLQNRPVKFAFIKTGNIIVNISFNFILILGFNFGIEAIFISNLFASLFSLIALSSDIFKNLQFKITKSTLLRMLKFALPYLPGSLAAMFVQVIDVPIIEMLTDKETLGIYRMNYKLGLVIMLIVSMFNYAWQPFFLNNAKEENAKEIFAKVFTIFLIALSGIWIILTLFIDDVVTSTLFGAGPILGQKYHEGLYIIPVILLAYIFYGMYSNFTAGIYIKEKTKYFPLVTITAAAANVGINLLLVPGIGIMGGAVATLVSYIIMAAGLFIVSQKFYRIQYEYSKVIKIMLMIAGVVLIYYYLSYYELLTIYIKIFILFGFAVSFLLLKIISLKELKTLFVKLKITG